MKSRQLPNPANYKSSDQNWLKNDPQVKKWTKRLLGDPDAVVGDLPEDALLYILSEVERRRDVEKTPIYQALVATCPTVVAPDLTDTLGDLELIFRQPELVEFWRNWTLSRGERGPAIDWSKAKGALTYLAFRRPTVTLEGSRDDIRQKPGFQNLFAALDAAAGGARGPSFEMPSYPALAKQLPKISTTCSSEAVAANIALVKALAELMPKAGIGKRLLIDGTSVPAWVEQRGSRGDADREEALRQRTPEAGFRAYSHRGPNGKRVLAEHEVNKAPTKTTKYWRGYYLVVIADQASGLPLVWTLFDASHDEAQAIVPLLSDLYRLWPDCPAELIVGDSAWDEDRWCRLCEVEYGLHPVFRLHPSLRKKQNYLEANASRNGSVSAYTGQGQLVCQAHQVPLPFDTFEVPTRRGLQPGDSAPEGEFRLRALCRHATGGQPPCGRVGLRAKLDWSALTYYPHQPKGNPKRYAMRQALLIRLNQIESIFNRLKSAGIAVGDADRHRFNSKETIEAIVSLSLLGMTGATVAEQRQRHGKQRGPLPRPKPIAALPAQKTAPSTPAKPASFAPIVGRSRAKPGSGKNKEVASPAAPRQLPLMQLIQGGGSGSYQFCSSGTNTLRLESQKERAG